MLEVSRKRESHFGMKLKVFYDLEYLEGDVPETWQLQQRFKSSQKSLAKAQYKYWNKMFPSMVRLYEVTRKKVRVRK